MQTLQRAVAEIRELENEEIDLVAGGSGFCISSESTNSATNSQQTYAAYGHVYVVTVQDDSNSDTVTSFGWD
ncbi:hypothetical protein [Sphingomonas crusticola]|uniref:hypothetical protein n=1 Tax=Sphingomonas crusticola TaxID=1697973 RepID=UPI000E25816A|nr:hypothetical protein [Sphingomonas crusticola]